jgi:hypothetical protein
MIRSFTIVPHVICESDISSPAGGMVLGLSVLIERYIESSLVQLPDCFGDSCCSNVEICDHVTRELPHDHTYRPWCGSHESSKFIAVINHST